MKSLFSPHPPSGRQSRRSAAPLIASAIIIVSIGVAGGFAFLHHSPLFTALPANTARAVPPPQPNIVNGSQLPTGKTITPQGTQTNVGSYPTTLLLSPNGKFIAVSSLGARANVTILSAQTGAIVSQIGHGACVGRNRKRGDRFVRFTRGRRPRERFIRRCKWQGNGYAVGSFRSRARRLQRCIQLRGNRRDQRFFPACRGGK